MRKSDKKIKDAMEIAQNIDVRELERQCGKEPEHVFSSGFENKINSALPKENDTARKRRYIKRAAVAFCCCAIVFASFIVYSSGYHKNIVQPQNTDTEDLKFNLTAKTSFYNTFHSYEPINIPSGYKYYSREETDKSVTTEYRNSSGDEIVFEQNEDFSDFTETGYERTVIIKRVPIECYRKDDKIVLKFDAMAYSFTVSGTADFEEMLKMTELKEIK